MSLKMLWKIKLNFRIIRCVFEGIEHVARLTVTFIGDDIGDCEIDSKKTLNYQLKLQTDRQTNRWNSRQTNGIT